MDGRILLVDDEKDIVDLLENVLTEEGFSLIQKAYTGTEAIRLCREYNPDIVILDIMLPDLDGLEVCRNTGILLLLHPVPFLPKRRY